MRVMVDLYEKVNTCCFSYVKKFDNNNICVFGKSSTIYYSNMSVLLCVYHLAGILLLRVLNFCRAHHVCTAVIVHARVDVFFPSAVGWHS